MVSFNSRNVKLYGEWRLHMVIMNTIEIEADVWSHYSHNAPRFVRRKQRADSARGEAKERKDFAVSFILSKLTEK